MPAVDSWLSVSFYSWSGDPCNFFVIVPPLHFNWPKHILNTSCHWLSHKAVLWVLSPVWCVVCMRIINHADGGNPPAVSTGERHLPWQLLGRSDQCGSGADDRSVLWEGGWIALHAKRVAVKVAESLERRKITSVADASAHFQPFLLTYDDSMSPHFW